MFGILPKIFELFGTVHICTGKLYTIALHGRLSFVWCSLIYVLLTIRSTASFFFWTFKIRVNESGKQLKAFGRKRVYIVADHGQRKLPLELRRDGVTLSNGGAYVCTCGDHFAAFSRRDFDAGLSQFSSRLLAL